MILDIAKIYDLYCETEDVMQNKCDDFEYVYFARALEKEFITQIKEMANKLTVAEIAEIYKKSSDMDKHGNSKVDEKLFVKNIIKKVIDGN